MTLTKTAGALCGSLLIFLLGGWAAETIYSAGGHGEDDAQGYAIDTGEDESEDDEGEEETDLAALFEEADASKGERVFNQCSACHKLEDGENGVGPHLYGVVARDVGSVEDFEYSGALSDVVDVWSAEELYAFLEKPSDYAPGTSMGYSGLSKPEDRVNLIAYLDESDGEDNIDIASAESEGGDGSDDEGGDEGSDEGSDEGAEDGSGEASEDSSDEGSEGASEDGSEDEGSEEASGDDGSGFEDLVASADADAGEEIYQECQSCHQLEQEQNGAGPHLVGIIGRDIASVDGFDYSDALSSKDGEWTLDELSAWIKNPDEYAEGNQMGYQGLEDEQDRADLMAYLESVQD